MRASPERVVQVLLVAALWARQRPLRILAYAFYSLALAFGFGAAGVVAIVHAFSPAVDRPCLALGRSPAGIAVDSPAGPLVHFVCILLVPPGKRRAGFRLLNGLVVLLREPMVRTQLLLAETPEEALAICRDTEGSRWATTAVWLKERLAAALRPSAAAGIDSGD
ncbi:MAG: PTS sugar transporter subunit IIA [Deltaproteobacteria bacterium]|nr:PTS sugar transporter subunit IIA [Deltaproteobacteria bacterium]